MNKVLTDCSTSKNKGAIWFPYFTYVLMITFIWYIGEAISMSSRVVVLTGRPSKVKKIFEIEMENKSSPINNRKCKEFSMYYDMIWKEIDYHV
jgi:ABC-type nitrate/sulfonate/bicarbonate transport system ATPase subunit